jgi:hypothetical protein
MTQPALVSDYLVQARAETLERNRRHADGCILLALVTSTDIAATLIDQAVDLHAALDRAPVPV